MNQINLLILNDRGITQYSDTAEEIDREVGLLLNPLINKYISEDINIRDMEYIVAQRVSELFLVARLRQGSDAAKLAKQPIVKSGESDDHQV